MIKKIHHLGIAVNDLAGALKTLKEAFGMDAVHIEEVESQKVKVAFVPVGETRLELLQPTSEDSPVQKFLATRGEGFHHVAFETEDVAEGLRKAEEAGLRLIDKEPRAGAHDTRVGFVHPKSTFGVLIELVEDKKTR